MASSSTSESDSLPVSSACKAQRWYESQSRRLNNEGEKFFPRFARTDRHYAPLCTHQSQHKIASYGPAQYRHPPVNIHRSAPAACRPRLPLTQQSRRMLGNFPPGCPPLQIKLCTALHSAAALICPQEDTTSLGATLSPLLLNAQPVDFVDSIRYLGLTISTDLSWSKHIKTSPPKQGN